MVRISREDAKYFEDLQLDREKQELIMATLDIWQETADFYYNREKFKALQNKFSNYSPNALNAEFSKKADLIYSLKEKISDENSNSLFTICDDLLPKFNFFELEYIRYKLTEQEHLKYAFIKDVNHVATKVVMDLLKGTQICEVYPKFTKIFKDKLNLKKCYTDNYLDDYVCTRQDSSNFKYFIDRLSTLHNEFVKINSATAEKSFKALINDTLQSQTKSLAIISTKETKKGTMEMRISIVIFANKRAMFNFYPLNQIVNLILTMDDEGAHAVMGMEANRNDVVLSDKITKSLLKIYDNGDLSEYLNLSKKLIIELVKSKYLVKKNETDELCQICGLQPATRYKNQKTCILCGYHVKALAAQAGINSDNAQRTLKQKENESFKQWQKRQKRYLSKRNYINWL